MTIQFTNRRHVVAAARVAFEANVEGRPVWCSVSLDALNDHFGNTGTSSHGLLQSFEANRPKIEAAARDVLEKNGGQSVELETRDLDWARRASGLRTARARSNRQSGAAR